MNSKLKAYLQLLLRDSPALTTLETIHALLILSIVEYGSGRVDGQFVFPHPCKTSEL